MATQTLPIPAWGVLRPSQAHIQPLPHLESTEAMSHRCHRGILSTATKPPPFPGSSKTRRPGSTRATTAGASHGGSGADATSPRGNRKAGGIRAWPGQAGTAGRRRAAGLPPPRPSDNPPAPRGGGRASGPKRSLRGARARQGPPSLRRRSRRRPGRLLGPTNGQGRGHAQAPPPRRRRRALTCAPAARLSVGGWDGREGRGLCARHTRS